MPPGITAKPSKVTGPARKRNRKRKRRVAFSSSSSSSSSDESSGESPDESVAKVQKSPQKVVRIAVPKASSESASSSSSSDSSSEEDAAGTKGVQRPTQSSNESRTHIQKGTAEISSRTHASLSPSPSPPPPTLPTFLPENGSKDDNVKNQQVLREKFRKFWMASAAEGFRDDLEQIRKEPNLNTSKLALLIDSLASGADVFTSSEKDGENGVNEINVILD
ncbi:hypothetical protein AX17_002435 [Amanita inopinata Kibby_2008]|nr:hypothetical protein AX17_002435 [Amanita inopinata Kibby_2008]